MNKKNVWTTYNRTQLKECDKFAESYKNFLDNSKTEREAVDTIVNEIEAEGYRELNKLISQKTKLKAGDKVYSVWMNKSIVMFKIGSEPLEKGLNILGAHIDSPRLDVKQNPLYEDNGYESALGADYVPQWTQGQALSGISDRQEAVMVDSLSGKRCRKQRTASANG